MQPTSTVNIFAPLQPAKNIFAPLKNAPNQYC